MTKQPSERVVAVPVEFVQRISALKHNWSLEAIPPDSYYGVERDAFREAYRRCGKDIAEAYAMLAAPPSERDGGVDETKLRALLADMQLQLETVSIAPNATDAAVGHTLQWCIAALQATRLDPVAAPQSGASDGLGEGEREWKELCSQFEDDIAASRINNAAMVFTKMRSAGQLLLRRLSQHAGGGEVTEEMIERFASKYWGADWGTAHGCHTVGQMNHERANIRDALRAALGHGQEKGK